MIELINKYQNEKTCEYRNESYRVRDNGSVFRNKRVNKRKRPLDEKWTFGNLNKQSDYMNIGSETVHRIVATAFYEAQPSEKHVVDHIDTNRQNNRPENLRWITKLENILLNPITLQRIIFSYGSIDNFFRNPSKPLYKNKNSNFDWMRTVTKEESENALKNLLSWSMSGTIPNGGQLEKWIFSGRENAEVPIVEEDITIQSITGNASQINWRTPSKFPNCPETTIKVSLSQYKDSLKKDCIFSINRYGESKVIKADLNKESDELVVLTKSESIKPYALAKIYLNGNIYVHENIGSFFKIDGAEKQFTLNLGKEWGEGDTFDELIS